MSKVKVRAYSSPGLVLLAFNWPDADREPSDIDRIVGMAGMP